MAISIRIKRGTEANILAATLAAGEMAFATDTKAVFISDGTAKNLVGKSLSGTFAARPSFGVAGRTYYDSTNNVLWVDTGSDWVQPQIVYASEANIPSADQKAALAGTDGTPAAANKFVTNSDPRLSAVGTIEAHTQAATTITGGAFTAGNYTFPAAASGTTLTVQCSTGDFASLGSELVTNGAFASNADSWTVGEGWEYDGTNHRVNHIPNSISTISIANGGTGYTQSDILTIGGGTGGTATVASVNAGVVTGVTLATGGTGYTVATQTTTGGTGNGCTINVLTLCTADLEQNVSASASNMYRVVFTTTRSAGSVTPSVGGSSANYATAVSSATTSTQDLYSANTGNLKFTPSADFNGSVDTVSCKLLTASTPGIVVKSSANNTQLEVRRAASSGGVFLGTNSGKYNYSAANNTGTGVNCLAKNTSATDNTAYGYQSLTEVTSGSHNTAIGSSALAAITTGTYNVAVGRSASPASITGSRNIAIGPFAQYLGTSGARNIAIGYSSLYSNLTGSYTVAVGDNAGYSSIGSSNIFIGYQSGYSETGSNKLYISNSNTTFPLIYGEFDNNLLKIKGDVKPTTDDTYDLGGSSNRWDDIYATNSTIQTSDVNKKDSITDLGLGLEFITKLRPVAFKWKDYTYTEQVALPIEYEDVEVEYTEMETDEEGNQVEVTKTRTEQRPKPQEFEERTVEKTFRRKHSGLIAQEVKDVLDELEVSTLEFAGYVDTYDNGLALRYEEFIAPIIKSIQELSARVEALES